MAPKIVIIGGGIGGLTAAIALARAGLDAEVYEQALRLEEVGPAWACGPTRCWPSSRSGCATRRRAWSEVRLCSWR